MNDMQFQTELHPTVHVKNDLQYLISSGWRSVDSSENVLLCGRYGQTAVGHEWPQLHSTFR
jgi:hypothetical protein